jgi:hypothetical protein
MRYPTRGYQRDPPSALLLRRPQEIYTLMEKPENLGIAIDMESHIRRLVWALQISVDERINLMPVGTRAEVWRRSKAVVR